MSLFVRMWVLKEAYLKALGTGIEGPAALRRFGFGLGPGPSNGSGPLRITMEDSATKEATQRWSFWLMQPEPGMLAGVCLERAADLAHAAPAIFRAGKAGAREGPILVPLLAHGLS